MLASAGELVPALWVATEIMALGIARCSFRVTKLRAWIGIFLDTTIRRK